MVSVLMPVRDAEPWLDEAVRSLADQTFTEFEVIAVDDGSADGSPAVLTEWAARDPRIRVVAAGVSGGPGDLVRALELGRAQARGRLIARMDADDVAPPERIQAQVELLDQYPDVVLCGTPVRTEPEAGQTEGARQYESWLNALRTPEDIERDLLVECPVAHPTFCVRAEALDHVGGYRSVDGPEDYDLLLRLARAGGRFAQADCSAHRWRDHPDRLQRTDARYRLEAFQNLKVEHLIKTDLADPARPVIVWGSGPTGKAFARKLAGVDRPPAAFVDLDPRKIGQRIHGAPVLAPEDVGPPAGRFALAAVAGPVPRAQIRADLTSRGWAEIRDFRVVA